MLDEPRSQREATRRPPVDGHRATVASVAGHCVVLALLALVGVRRSLPPAEAPLIMAEFVTVQRATLPAETLDELTTSPSTTTEPAPSAPSATAPLPSAEQLTPAPPPPPPESRTTEPLEPADAPPSDAA